jgi:DNA-binding MarR family transcriptional regulator
MPSGNQKTPGLTLTITGQNLRERLRPSVMAAEDRIMAPLSDSEREVFKDLASRVIKANDVKLADESDR